MKIKEPYLGHINGRPFIQWQVCLESSGDNVKKQFLAIKKKYKNMNVQNPQFLKILIDANNNRQDGESISRALGRMAPNFPKKKVMIKGHRYISTVDNLGKKKSKGVPKTKRKQMTVAAHKFLCGIARRVIKNGKGVEPHRMWNSILEIYHDPKPDGYPELTLKTIKNICSKNKIRVPA